MPFNDILGKSPRSDRFPRAKPSASCSTSFKRRTADDAALWALLSRMSRLVWACFQRLERN